MLQSGDWNPAIEISLDYPAPPGYAGEQATAVRPATPPRLYSAAPASRPIKRGSGALGDSQYGIDRVQARLMELLDDRWTIFRGLRLANPEEEIALVLVGPGGIFMLEVPPYGNWRLHNGQWYRETSAGEWIEETNAPGIAARETANRLGEYLWQRGIRSKNHVQAIIMLVWDHPLVSRWFGTEIWRLDEIESQLLPLRQANDLLAFRANRIAAALKGLLPSNPA